MINVGGGGGLLALNTVGITVGTSHTTVSTPGGYVPRLSSGNSVVALNDFQTGPTAAYVQSSK